ncbi:MAG: Slp family lipoprotein [Nitrospinales bacterium]
MRTISKWSLVLFGWTLMFLSGCAPVLSSGVIQQSDTSVTFPDLVRTPANYTGKTVVLGGTIINLKDLATGTELEVLQRPLGYRMEPLLNDQSGGRFLVLFDQFLDDKIYERGRKITLAVKVVGSETRSLEGIQYTYPILKEKEHYLWPKVGRYYSDPRFYFGIGINHSF